MHQYTKNHSVVKIQISITSELDITDILVVQALKQKPKPLKSFYLYTQLGSNLVRLIEGQHAHHVFVDFKNDLLNKKSYL